MNIFPSVTYKRTWNSFHPLEEHFDVANQWGDLVSYFALVKHINNDILREFARTTIGFCALQNNRWASLRLRRKFHWAHKYAMYSSGILNSLYLYLRVPPALCPTCLGGKNTAEASFVIAIKQTNQFLYSKEKWLGISACIAVTIPSLNWNSATRCSSKSTPTPDVHRKESEGWRIWYPGNSRCRVSCAVSLCVVSCCVILCDLATWSALQLIVLGTFRIRWMTCTRRIIELSVSIWDWCRIGSETCDDMILYDKVASTTSPS